ncbi:hypothetical protein K3495_g6545 [Podosphaera aphanis]|nr:hypothetical protein K3495_g6545 [Podosphaera aphanis]
MEKSTTTPLTSGPPLPTFFRDSATELITQGAEALVYRTTYLLPTRTAAVKHRPPKPYRHPTLDARLTRHRILSEARVLVRCRREGVSVPALYALDEQEGWLMVEWIEGEVLRRRLNDWRKEQREIDEGNEILRGLMVRIGNAIGRLHAIGVIHGDLTTSNLMLKWDETVKTKCESKVDPLQGDIVLIDFGLASQSSQDEDRAVDLYVLERAFGSTHPWAEGFFAEVLKAYGKSFKGAVPVLKKLEDVRMRGRKRSMLG